MSDDSNDMRSAAMNILVIIPESVRYGGTVRFLERLLAIHAHRGLVTKLLVPSDQCHGELIALAGRHAVDLVSAPDRAGAHTPPVLTPFFDLLFSGRTVLSWRPDLIVVSTADPGRMSIALYFPVPVLYILHSMPEHRFRFLPRCYLHIGSLLHNRIVTVSNAAAESVSRCMGIPRRRIDVVHNSCRIGMCGNECGDRPVILTVGHLVEYKNPWLWLHIARSVLTERPDSLFVWLGDGDLLEPLSAKVRELSLEERILLPGYLEDPSSWYRKASVYLQPSRRESHGIAVLEAMAHGLPCVVADSGGMPESVIDGETGYVCPLADPASFVSGIRTLLDDSRLRSTLGDAGRQRVESCFSEELQEQKLFSLYEQLAKQTRK